MGIGRGEWTQTFSMMLMRSHQETQHSRVTRLRRWEGKGGGCGLISAEVEQSHSKQPSPDLEPAEATHRRPAQASSRPASCVRNLNWSLLFKEGKTSHEHLGFWLLLKKIRRSLLTGSACQNSHPQAPDGASGFLPRSPSSLPLALNSLAPSGHTFARWARGRPATTEQPNPREPLGRGDSTARVLFDSRAARPTSSCSSPPRQDCIIHMKAD